MPSQQEIAKAFAMFDRNGDGLLSLDELKAILCRPTPKRAPITEAQVKEIMEKCDANGDGKLSMEELAVGWAHLSIMLNQAWHDLPSVNSSKASDEPQLWHAIETAEATAATLECTWSDQGYGNQKGMVFARKAGGQWVPLSTSAAPHSPTRLSVAIPTKVLGGKLEFAYRVGGGGGHSLSIESAAIEVHGAGRSGVLNVGEIKYTSMPHGARTPDSQTLCRSPSDSHA